MASLTPSISFAVKFLLGGTPAIKLTVSTTLPSGQETDLKGYFAITQPDGITVTGNYTSPDIYYSGGALVKFTKTLRLAADETHQRGTYTIVFYCDHPDYTPGVFTRSFEFDYKPVTQTIKELFDVFTPNLSYADQTSYIKNGWTITSNTSSWHATTQAGSVTPSSSATFSLAINSSYYDASYLTSYVKLVNYVSVANSWLTIQQTFSQFITGNAYTPSSMATLLTYLDALKAKKAARPCDNSLNELYEKASVLYTHIRSKVCSRSTDGLKDYFDEFYKLTHNYQTRTYTHTNAVIPAYDFTTGCAASTPITPASLSYRPTPGVSSFTVSALSGKTITGVSRSGRTRGITTGTTTDMEFLQIVGTQTTLPTGDVVAEVDLNGETVGELFIYNYY